MISVTPRGEEDDALAAFGVLAGPEIGTELPVRSPVVRVGRSAANDLVIDDDSVSANHARLDYDRGAWRLTDLDSVNGTFVESVRLAPQVPTPLPYGAAVRLGGVRLQFRQVEAADPGAARATYVEPERDPTLREERRFRFPVWALVLLLVLAALLAFWLLQGPLAIPPTPTPAPTALHPALLPRSVS